MPLVFVGETSNLTDNHVTSIALPSGTQVGDLVTVAMLRTGPVDVTDSRFRLLHRRSSQSGVWVCDALPSLGAVAVDASGTNTAARQVMQVCAWTGNRDVTGEVAATGTGDTVTFPALGSSQQAAVGVVIGFAEGFAPPVLGADATGAWDFDTQTGGLSKAGAYQWAGSGVPPAGAISFAIGDFWSAVTIGVLVEAPPVRQYPRDDGLGHSSAPRKFPPVKARRIVGGYT